MSMVTAPPTRSRRPHRGVALACGCAVVGAFTVTAVYASLLLAGRSSITSPAFFIGNALTTVVVSGCAWMLASRGQARTAVWLAVLALALVAYSALLTAATGLTLRHGALLGTTATLGGLWYLVVFMVGSRVIVVAIEALTGPRAGLRRWTTVNLVLFAGAFILALAVDPAIPGVQAPLGGTVLQTPPFMVMFVVFGSATMLSFAIPPVLAWRAAAAVPPAGPQRVRDRLTLVAIAASCPILALLTCVLLGLTETMGLLSASIAETVLSMAFSVPLTVFAAGIAVAFTASVSETATSLQIATRWVLTGLWLLVGIQLAIVVAGLLGRVIGDKGLLAVATVASVLTVCFFAAYVPVSRRVLAFTTPIEADRLTQLLSPREREVLARIAAGQSNAGIASELCLSERTVDSHVTAIFNKLGLDRSSDVNRRVQAAAAWLTAQPKP